MLFIKVINICELKKRMIFIKHWESCVKKFWLAFRHKKQENKLYSFPNIWPDSAGQSRC